jgi:hypothetical protein
MFDGRATATLPTVEEALRLCPLVVVYSPGFGFGATILGRRQPSMAYCAWVAR